MTPGCIPDGLRVKLATKAVGRFFSLPFVRVVAVELEVCRQPTAECAQLLQKRFAIGKTEIASAGKEPSDRNVFVKMFPVQAKS